LRRFPSETLLAAPLHKSPSGSAPDEGGAGLISELLFVCALTHAVFERTLMTKLLASAALMLGLALTGCGVDAAVDCQGICSRYKTCFNSNYDVQACEERCRSNAAADKSYKAKADSCKACIDGNTCTAAAFSCSADCLSIVP
jgi:hypothetical protein